LADLHRLTLTRPPATLAVDDRLVREHVRVDDGIENYLVRSYIETATAYLDGWTGILGRALVDQGWTMVLPGFPAGCISIPMGPVTSIVSVTYKDANGAVQTLAPSGYDVALRADGAVLRTVSGWPATGDYLDPVSVEFAAGTGCPKPVQTAIMMMVAGIFDGRQGDDMLTPAVRALIAPFRRRMV